jgi:hypothetical protein
MPNGEWSQRSRFSKLASVLYPGHATDRVRAQMAERAKNEGKAAPKPPALLDDHSRGPISPLGGTIKR